MQSPALYKLFVIIIIIIIIIITCSLVGFISGHFQASDRGTAIVVSRGEEAAANVSDAEAGCCSAGAPTAGCKVTLNIVPFSYNTESRTLLHESRHLYLQCRVKGSYRQSPPFFTVQGQRILLTVATFPSNAPQDLTVTTFPYSAGPKDPTESGHLSLQCRVKGSYWQSPPFPTRSIFH